MWRSCLFVALAAAGAVGCAHNKANQYAYAPPLAPAVYPQPQMAAQPVAYAAPGASPNVTVAPGPVPPAGVVMASGDPCCPPPSLNAAAAPVVYAADQTPPCPPGP